MKKITTSLFSFLFLLAISSNAQDNGQETMKQFVKDIPALSTENITTIGDLAAAAQKNASKTIELTKENMAQSLKDAEGKTCIIIVENHTIVRFSDVKKCRQSGAWGACMPYGEGYIKSGAFTSTNDYINNIIGIPDTQKRTLFVF